MNHAHHHHEHTPDECHNRAEILRDGAQTLILLGMGFYFLNLARPGGNLPNYINIQNLGWLSWVGGFIFLLLGSVSAADLLTNRSGHDHHDHDHNHAPAGSLRAWLFLFVVALPLLFGLGVPSRPLGADAITGELLTDVTSLGLSAPTTLDLDLPPEQRSLLDWLRLFGSGEDLRRYAGQPVDVIGFVYRDARFAGTDRFMVARFVLSCCVADARPMGMIAQMDSGASLKEDTWIRITGVVTVQQIDGIDTPVIQIETLEPTAQPAQPYLYF